MSVKCGPAAPGSVLKRPEASRVLMGRVEDALRADLPTTEHTRDVDWADAYAAQRERERERLYGLALVILRESNDASDAVQAAFEKAFRHRGQLRDGVAPNAASGGGVQRTRGFRDDLPSPIEGWRNQNDRLVRSDDRPVARAGSLTRGAGVKPGHTRISGAPKSS